jgi:hypothetical protein
MKATRKLTAAVIAAGTASAVLTGCGNSTDDSTAPIVRAATATTSADTGPYADLTGAQLLDRAMDAMTAVSSLTMDLRTTDDDGSPIHVTAALTKAGKCAASFDQDGTEFQVIGTGDVYYLKADADYWRAHGGSNGAALAQALSAKWLKMPMSVAGSEFSTFCELTGLLAAFTEGEDGAETTAKGRSTDYDGTQVIPLTVHDSEGDTLVDVATVGEPYILAMYTPNDDTNRATFSGFGDKPAIAAPPANQTVDISKYADLPGFSV